MLKISFPPELQPYFVLKGSIALNGISLTISNLGHSAFEVELIPLTLTHTNLKELRVGDKVNIECDMIGKYVYNWISKGKR